LLRACAQLSPADFIAARTSFFPSIKATLNHNLTVDWYYVDALERAFRGEAPNTAVERFFDPEEPFAACAELQAAQRAVDRRLVDACADRGVPLPAVYLADTMGWANPEDIKRRIGAVREIVPQARIGLHLHDTRGLGGANVYAALQMGVELFDSSVAGLGGCPFAEHKTGSAAGNVCTEDMAFMCEELGIATGIDLEALVEASRLAERIIGRPLNGHLMHSGTLAAMRG